MEVYGWNKVETFQNSLEAIIFFRKPNKSLSILIKSDKFKIDYSHVTIFIKEN
jgi:hypothetical protein